MPVQRRGDSPLSLCYKHFGHRLHGQPTGPYFSLVANVHEDSCRGDLPGECSWRVAGEGHLGSAEEQCVGRHNLLRGVSRQMVGLHSARTRGLGG